MSDLRNRKQKSNMYIEQAVIKYDEEAEHARKKKQINELTEKLKSYEKLLSESSKAKATVNSSSDDPTDSNPEPKSDEKASLFSANALKANAAAKSMSANANAKLAHANILNANATGANASANADATLANANVANANATGVSTSASASATGANLSAANLNATGASASVHANTTGLEMSALNVNATGAEITADASATGVRFSAGNVNVKGTGAAANASVTGTGVSCFNVGVSGPRAGASVSASGEVQFGNVDIGFTPSLNIGLGLNLGIPFLSSGGGGGGNKDGSSNGSNNASNNGGSGQSKGNDDGKKGKFMQRIREQYPNKSHVCDVYGLLEKHIHRSDGNTVNIETIREKTPIVIDKIPGVPVCDGENGEGCTHNADSTVNGNPEKQGLRCIGYRGTAREHNRGLPTYRNQRDEIPESDAHLPWPGLYSTPDPNTAAGYTIADDGTTQPIVKVFAKTKVYFDKTHGMNSPEAAIISTELQRETNNNYSFGGTQNNNTNDPVLRSAEFVTRSKYPIVTIPSVHRADGGRLDSYHPHELDANLIVPDHLVSVDRSTFNATDAVDSTMRHDHELGNAIENAIRNKRKNELVQKLIDNGVDMKDIEDIDEYNEAKNLLKAIELSLSSAKSSNASIQDENYDEEEMLRKAIEMSLSTNTDNEGESESDDKDDTNSTCNHDKSITGFCCLKEKLSSKIKKIGGNIFGFDN